MTRIAVFDIRDVKIETCAHIPYTPLPYSIICINKCVIYLLQINYSTPPFTEFV